MITKYLAKSRLYVKYIVEKNPLMLCIAEFFLLRFSFLLPHDNDYYGFLKLANKKKGLFLDVGANDGRSVLSFNKLKKDWEIFSFEANPLHVPHLKKVQSKLSNLKFLISAVDKESGKKLTLYTPAYSFYKIYAASSTDMEHSRENVEGMFGSKIGEKIRYIRTNAETIKIDDLKLCPDIIKMDIEGGEYNALLGCVDTIKRCSPYFLIEYNEKNFKDISKFFNERNYLPYGFDSKKMIFTTFAEDKFRNCFFIPNNIHVS